MGVLGNEKADELAKLTAEELPRRSRGGMAWILGPDGSAGESMHAAPQIPRAP